MVLELWLERQNAREKENARGRDHRQPWGLRTMRTGKLFQNCSFSSGLIPYQEILTAGSKNVQSQSCFWPPPDLHLVTWWHRWQQRQSQVPPTLGLPSPHAPAQLTEKQSPCPPQHLSFSGLTNRCRSSKHLLSSSDSRWGCWPGTMVYMSFMEELTLQRGVGLGGAVVSKEPAGSMPLAACGYALWRGFNICLDKSWWHSMELGRGPYPPPNSAQPQHQGLLIF